MLSKNFKSKGIGKIMHEFQHLKEKLQKYPFDEGQGSYELLNCTFCDTNFEFAVEHMYHLLKDEICSQKIKEYCKKKIYERGLADTVDQNNIPIAILTDKLTRNIQFHSNDLELKCGQCSHVSASKIYHLVHLDRHLRKGRVYPCYKCAKIYLAPYWFIQHKCLMEIKTESSTIRIAPEINVHYLYEKVDKSVRDRILTCPMLNCSKKYNFISGIFSHLQLRTPCLLGLIKGKKMEFEWDCSVDFEKLIKRVYKIETSMIQCEICNEICFSELAYLMHVDHHRLHTTLECLQCNTEFMTVCSFYNHSCQTQSSPFCVLCNAFKIREATPYVYKKPAFPNEPEIKQRNIGELAKSIEVLMDEIVNYNEDDDDEATSEPKPMASNARYQKTFIDFLNNSNGGNGNQPEEIVIDLSDDDNSSLTTDVFDSVDDLLAGSDDDEYIEPGFEIKSENTINNQETNIQKGEENVGRSRKDL